MPLQPGSGSDIFRYPSFISLPCHKGPHEHIQVLSTPLEKESRKDLAGLKHHPQSKRGRAWQMSAGIPPSSAALCGCHLLTAGRGPSPPLLSLGKLGYSPRVLVDDNEWGCSVSLLHLQGG